jgi:hypothetical protein
VASFLTEHGVDVASKVVPTEHGTSLHAERAGSGALPAAKRDLKSQRGDDSSG